jgi:succinate dehydrogenase flavin-adding protein (antitoxin of CptAB toxin-antitoxin module)
MRELDRAFNYILDEEYPRRGADFQGTFEAFCDEQDPDILAMLSGRMPVPDAYLELVALMRQCGAKLPGSN